MSSFFSVIPARKGSQGIPKKNIYPLAGKPLIQWTIEASLKSSSINNTIISSDSDEILRLSEKFDVKLHKRNKKYSTNSARSEDVVLNILDELPFLKFDHEFLVLLQPTSPLRNEAHIDEACKLINDSKADSLISVKEIDNHILKALIKDKSGSLIPGFNKNFPFMPRQELPKTFMPNGAIYICRISSILDSGSLHSENNIHYLMKEDFSHDIDDLNDIKLVNRILKGELKNKSTIMKEDNDI